ncbi:hypothetical protein, partial [Caldithrix abyssi]
MKNCLRTLLIFMFTLSFLLPVLNAQQLKWYKVYYNGLQAMERGDYSEAVEHFKACLKVKNVDRKKIRAYGTTFIQYFPHRELGIALYHLGKKEEARKHLMISLNQQPSLRAKRYLQLVKESDGYAPPISVSMQTKPTEPEKLSTTTKTESNNMNLVGERLSIAVLPFSSQGIGAELQDIDFLDKLITGFVNSG